MTSLYRGIRELTMSLSQVFSVGLTACLFLAVAKYGWGTHIWDVPPPLLAPSRKISWTCMILYMVASSCCKLSILVFYMRILVAPLDKLITKITLAACVGYFISILFVLFFQCKPFGHYWNYLLGEKGECISETAHLSASGSLNLLFDIIIFLIPLRSLLALKIRTSQKMQVVALFGCGILVIVAAALRLYYNVIVVAYTYDATWYGYTAFLWSMVETQVGPICACVPSCRVLVVSWRKQLRSKSGSGNRSGVGYPYGSYPTYDFRKGSKMGTVNSYVNMDEDMGLTVPGGQGPVGHTSTKVTAGSLKSETSEEIFGEVPGGEADGKSGVRIQMEVMQHREDWDGDERLAPPRPQPTKSKLERMGRY
jgi:hypothetical protein